MAKQAQANQAAAQTQAPAVVPPVAPAAAAAASTAQAQAPALRTDTKVAARTAAADAALAAVKFDPRFSPVAGLAPAPVDSVRGCAKGNHYAAPGAYMLALGTAAPSPKAPQHQLAVAALRKVLADAGQPADAAADMLAVQQAYRALGGTDPSIFVGRTRLYTNSSKAAMQAGKALAPLTAYHSPAPAKA